MKRKKARVLPMKEEDMFIAQKTPELRVIVVGSELFANRFPWVTITNGGLDMSCKFKVLNAKIVKSHDNCGANDGQDNHD